MKRPRFGLKLIFLITALVAVCAAWRHAVGRKQLADRETDVISLQEKLESKEAQRARFADILKQAGVPMTTALSIQPSYRWESLDSIDSDIKDLKDQIETLTR